MAWRLYLPSCGFGFLIETDFISNSARARRLRDKNFQENFSRHVTKAVKAFFKANPATLQRPGFPPERSSYHMVKRGDTLSGLAVRYGTSVARLQRLNSIKKGAVLHIGMKLKLM